MLDTENYHYAEFERQGANDSVMRIGKVSAGVDTVLQAATIDGITNTSRQVIAKISPREFCGNVSNSVLAIVSDKPSIIADGIYSGIQSLSAGMRIDRHIFEQHMETRDECGNCLCLCETNYMPPKLLATFLDCTNRMSSLNGGSMLLTWDRLNAQYRSDPAGTTLCTPGQTWRLSLNCPTDPADGSTARLGINSGCNNLVGVGPHAPLTYSCDPLEWYFGPFEVGPIDLTCGCGTPNFMPGAPSGFYSVLVTEAP